MNGLTILAIIVAAAIGYGIARWHVKIIAAAKAEEQKIFGKKP